MQQIELWSQNRFNFRRMSSMILSRFRMSALPTGTSLLLNTNHLGEGKLGVLLTLPAGQSLAAGTHELLRTTFRASANAVGSTVLGFGDVPVSREVVSADVDILPTQYSAGTIQFGGSVGPTLGETQLFAGLTITGVIGKAYRIEATSDIDWAPWTSAGTVTLSGAKQLWVDTSAPAQGLRFYRAVDVTQP